MKVLILQGYGCAQCWSPLNYERYEFGTERGPQGTVVGWCGNPACSYHEMKLRIAPAFVEAVPLRQ